MRTVVLGRFHVISKYQAELPNYTVISAAPRISCHLPRESPCALYTYSTRSLSLSTHTHTSTHAPTKPTRSYMHMLHVAAHVHVMVHIHVLYSAFFTPFQSNSFLFSADITEVRQRAGSTHTHAVWRTAAAAEAAPAEGGGGGGGGRRWWWCFGGRLRRA